MGTWAGWLIGIVAVVAAVLVLPWLAQRTMDDAGGAGGGGGPFGIMQELFHPGAHESSIVIAREAEGEQASEGGEDEDPEHEW